jgi:hypothetical protein
MGWNFPEPGAVTHCLGICSMDFDPQTGHCSFFRKNLMTNADGMAKRMAMTKNQKNHSNMMLPSYLYDQFLWFYYDISTFLTLKNF